MDVDPTMPQHPGVSQMRTVFLSLLAITMTNVISPTASRSATVSAASQAKLECRVRPSRTWKAPLNRWSWIVVWVSSQR
jgi:hypothetical protein